MAEKEIFLILKTEKIAFIMFIASVNGSIKKKRVNPYES